MIRARQILKGEFGQGMTEYIIIVALIAIAGIGVMSLFGRQIQELFAASGKALAGEGASTTDVGVRRQNYTLQNFGQSGK